MSTRFNSESATDPICTQPSPWDDLNFPPSGWPITEAQFHELEQAASVHPPTDKSNAALHLLAQVYRGDHNFAKDSFGVEADERVFFQLMTKASSQGWAPSSHALGRYYNSKHHATRFNEQQAIQYYVLAHAQDPKDPDLWHHIYNTNPVFLQVVYQVSPMAIENYNKWVAIQGGDFLQYGGCFLSTVPTPFIPL